MSAFAVRDGQLWCEGVALAALAQAVGTPLYVYSTAALEAACGEIHQGLAAAGLDDALVAFAIKANSNLAVLRTLARGGAGADVVSEGEIRRALAAGIAPDRIVFSGVGKTDAELALALDAGLMQINVETRSELRRLAAIAADKGVRAPISLRINPGVLAGGHAKISTGGAHDKFGVAPDEALRLYAEAAASPNLEPLGLSSHVGSQITDLAPFEASFSLLRRMTEQLRAAGMSVSRLDLGGGLGVASEAGPRPPAPADYAALAARVMAGIEARLIFEPGRLLVAEAGLLLTRVIHIHQRGEGGRRFMVVDAGMNDLMRPTLYDAHHEIRPVRPRPDAPTLAYDVVGPVCETGDTFARDRRLPQFEEGDLAAFMGAGAYGASMANEYNSRLLVPDVLISGDRWALVRARPSYEAMLARDVIPSWLT